MAGGGVTSDTCLALGRRCWAFDMEERGETRPEIEPHTWIHSPDQELSWPVSSKEKADLIIFDPPYFDKKADGYGEKSISGLQKKEYLEFLEAFFTLLKEKVKKTNTGCYRQVCDHFKTIGIKKGTLALHNWETFEIAIGPEILGEHNSNTELGISGYSFESFDEIAPHAEPDNGPTMTGLQAIAKKYGAFICLGFAEKDKNTGVFYNSALVIDPAGKIVCRYNRVNAEARWACPDPITSPATPRLEILMNKRLKFHQDLNQFR